MQFNKIVITAILLALFSCARAQNNALSSLKGIVTAANGIPLHGVTVNLMPAGLLAQTDQNGNYHIVRIQPGKYTLQISMTGYQSFEQIINLTAGQEKELGLQLRPSSIELSAVNVEGQTAIGTVRQQPFAIVAIDAKKLAGRDVDLNRLLDGQAGIRVQETGGMGSEFNYSINGLSGKAVKFFVDGIPMESFGTSFSINNLPVNLIDRIEVYKGVTPVELGGDVLGGAINVVTRRDARNYLDLSQSIGSFGTRRSAVSGKWRDKSGFTAQTNSFYNYADNNYQIWGPTVEVAGPDGRPIPGFPRFRRFNDDYRAYTIKTEAGFTNVPWADQLLIGVTYADQHRGIQTGRTMAYVYGDVRYRENFLMPSLRYSKQDFLSPGLSIDLYGAVNRLEGTTVDTSSNKYNWKGDVIAANANGELGGIRASKSIYSYRDNTTLGRLNLAYRLDADQKLSFNYSLNNTSRKGKDDIATAEWTIPFRQPQDMNKQVAGLAYEAVLYDQRWTNTFFIKNFHYSANATIYDYNGGSAKELFYRQLSNNSWGFGYATKILLPQRYMFKLSAENTSRLPEAAELLGNGNTILNSPALEPEKSFNVNLSLHKTAGTETRKLGATLSTFYRNTQNLIWLGEGDLMGSARYENLGRIRSAGIEAELNYTHNNWLEASVNATYQDIRNRQRYETSGAENHVYNDRLRNTPYLMANGEIRLYLDQPLQLKEKLTFYINTHYVHRYYLGWPSLGAAEEKMYIPTQFVQDAGLGYAFSDGRYSVNLDARNILDRQVFDNYLLQKPGRFISLKLRCLIQ